MNDEMQEILSDFLAESSEMLEALDQHFVKLETEPTNADLLNEIFRCMHSMKGSAGFLGFTHLVEVAHQGESLLNKLRLGEMSVSPFIIDIILEAVDAVKLLHTDIRETGEDSHVDTVLIVNKLILTMDSADDLNALMPDAPVVEEPSDVKANSAELEVGGTAVEETAIAEEPASQAETQAESIAVPEVVAEPESPPALSDMLNKMQEVTSRTAMAAAPASTKPAVKEEDVTVRVETKRLDQVMNLVGELVLGRNRLMKLGYGLDEQYETDPLVRELGAAFAQLNLVTSVFV